MSEPEAAVLLSGGLDSATCLAVARQDGFRATALTFRYGQRHDLEVERAQALARSLGAAAHHVISLDLAVHGGTSLVGSGDIPRHRSHPEQGGIPPTYVPARNTVFLAHGVAFAEAHRMQAVYIGVNAVDFSGYPDCRPAFIEAFQKLIEVGTRSGAEGRPIRICAPLLHLSKAQIVKMALRLGVDVRLTLSCYDPDPQGRACGSCDSCMLRKRGFQQAGVPDPTPYRT